MEREVRQRLRAALQEIVALCDECPAETSSWPEEFRRIALRGLEPIYPVAGQSMERAASDHFGLTVDDL